MISQQVAPFTGVWIETCICSSSDFIMCVAPFTGVWIETVPTFEGVEIDCRALHGRVD